MFEIHNICMTFSTNLTKQIFNIFTFILRKLYTQVVVANLCAKYSLIKKNGSLHRICSFIQLNLQKSVLIMSIFLEYDSPVDIKYQADFLFSKHFLNIHQY